MLNIPPIISFHREVQHKYIIKLKLHLNQIIYFKIHDLIQFLVHKLFKVWVYYYLNYIYLLYCWSSF